jgi:hypothetical protein
MLIFLDKVFTPEAEFDAVFVIGRWKRYVKPANVQRPIICF